jgi:Bacterial pre-peptidase C-terminal domain
MKNKLFVRSAMLAAILGTLVASRVALADTEVEPNDPYGNAQALTLVPQPDGTATATVNGSIDCTAAHSDVDYYSFYGHAGDSVTLNIDGGMNASYVGVWTVLAIFGPQIGSTALAPTTIPLAQDYIASSLDAGSVSLQDARIDSFPLPADGTYIVGVSSMNRMFSDINDLTTLTCDPGYGSGSYTLIVSGVTPAAAAPTPPPPPPAPVASVQSVSIDIMPGRRHVIWLSSANPHWVKRGSDHDRRHEMADEIRGHLKGGIPVALLSTDTFNAPSDVDQSSLRFGHTGDEQSLIRCNPHGIDVNRDGKPDLVCYFDASKANFQPGDTEGYLTGATTSDDQLSGEGFLKIMSGFRHPDEDGDRDRDRDEHRRHR